MTSRTNHEESYNFLFKIIIIGDAGVGKTNIMSRYLNGKLPRNVLPTMGVEYASKPVVLKNGQTVKAQLWDTAGQERFRAITSAHYRKSLGALIVYDVTDRRSFESA